MRKQTLGLVFSAALLVSTSSAAQQTTSTQAARLGSVQHGQVSSAFDRLPLTFEANQGQTGAQAKFIARGKGYSAFLTAGGMVLSLRPTPGVQANQMADATPTAGLNQSLKTTLQFKLLGANPNPTIIGEDEQRGRVNYFFGKDPKRWHTNVPSYARVRYKNVYPGIDLIYYGNHRQLEYDFAISPGADPRRIQFEITGANQIELDADGNLVLQTGSGELHFESPVVYQESNGQRVVIDGGYVMNDPTHIRFQVAQYDPVKALVIDPVLVYSTYLGGSGTDQLTGIAVDSTGSIYVAGSTDSIDFPLATLGSLPMGLSHVLVAKLDPTGSNLVYADYIGGSNQDSGSALVLDSANEVDITGSTQSTDFPIVNGYQSTLPGYHAAFVTRISADGSSLLYSTYLGGDSWNQSSGIALNSVGEVYVAGYTSSLNFPVANAYQLIASPNQGGSYGMYGFVTKFSADGSSLIYSTFLGGNSNIPQTCTQGPCWPTPFNIISGIAVDATDNAYVTGSTNTYNFPTTPGAYLTTDSAPQDALIGFVSKLSSTGSLDYSTYLYGSSGAPVQIASIAVDGSGSAYVTGTAPSDGTFPITSTSICDPTLFLDGCSYAFITKFDPTGSTLLYSTFLGRNNAAFPQAIVLDKNNDAYVLCETWGASFAIPNGIESYTNGADLLVAEIDPLASTELFATYLGGSGDEYPSGIAVDSSGNIYIGGQTRSGDFPVTSAAFQSQYGGGQLDAFVLKISAESAPSVAFSPATLQYASQTVGTISDPQLTLLRNMGSASLSISSISVTGDFAETDDCGTGVSAAGSCTFSVTFTPIGTGSRLGTIVIQDDAAGSPHVINLIGDGAGAAASLSLSRLSFAPVPVGSSSAAQSVTLSNTGSIPLLINGIQVTGAFAQTNNCQPVIPSGSGCIVNVTFIPTSLGTFSGALTITDNAPGSPQILNLAGTESDFSLASSVTKGSTEPGAAATYLLTVSPLGGSFTGAVKLSCSGLPAQTTCSLSPSAVTPGASPATATVTVSTMASLAGMGRGRRFNSLPLYAIWLPLQGMGLFGIVFAGSRRRSKKWRSIVLMGLMIVPLLLATACAGGTGMAPKPQSGPAPGTYNITVTGSSGALQHSLNLTLTVQ